MLGKDSDSLVASTPAFAGFHLVEEFHGQASPEVPVMQLDELQPVSEPIKRPVSEGRNLIRCRHHVL
jgi:hypothetical protein